MPKFNLTKHKELWNWLSENPGSLKTEWPGWGEIEDWDDEIYPYKNCFACEYLAETMLDQDNPNYALCGETCEKFCPLIWPKGCTCCARGSIFKEWTNATVKKDYETASNLARQIAELPVREGVETI